MTTFSEAYVNYLSAGPFAGRTDPWAEAGRYFHQIHGGMISDLLERLRLPLLQLGYVAAREASLQIVERTQPDVTVRSRIMSPESLLEWDYAEAATAVLAKPGVALEDSVPELEAINIRHRESGYLVTIIEVISPSNKDIQADMELYQERRLRLVNEQGINVVELDLTRSIKRLVRDLLATAYSYHIALHLPHDSRFIGMNYGESLERFALPLHQRVIPIETQTVYDAAYRQASIAPQFEDAGNYEVSKLPFVSLLSAVQRQNALASVQVWRNKLNELRTEVKKL